MGKWWKSGVLIGTWLGLVLAAHAQYGPEPPQSEPIPYGPSTIGQGPPPGRGGVIVGGLRGRDVPPGPDSNLGLPGDIPNAFAGENLIDPEAEVEGGFRVMAGVLLLQPRVSQAPAFSITNDSSSSVQEFSYNYSAGPWVELEFLWCSGWGVLRRYWRYDTQSSPLGAENSSTTTELRSTASVPGFEIVSPSPGNLGPFLPVPTTPPTRIISYPNGPIIPDTLRGAGLGVDRFTFDSRILVNVADLEVTRYVVNETWQMSLAAGARFATLSQSYQAIRQNGPGGFPFLTTVLPFTAPRTFRTETLRVDRDFSRLDYSQSFVGGGPSLALEARLPFSTTGLSFYANARGSVLVGQGKERASQAFQNRGDILTSSIDPANPLAIFFPQVIPYDHTPFKQVGRDWSQMVPVVEFEAGGSRDIPMSGLRPLLQAAFVSQNWYSAGTPTGRDGNLNLVGVKIGAGLQY